METKTKEVAVKKSANIFSIMAAKYQLAPEKFLETITKTIMRPGKDGRVATMEEIAAFLIVANKYGLDPFTNEIYAFPAKKGGIIPVIGVDGFVRKINTSPDFDGMEITFSEESVTMEGAKPCPEWCEVKLYRKDVTRPIIVREYLDEVYREPFKSKEGYVVTGPWQSHTKRMLRHKTIIQAGRTGGMLIGVYDEDEAQRIIDAEIVPSLMGKPEVAMPQELPPPEAQSTENQPVEPVKKYRVKSATEAQMKAIHTLAGKLYKKDDKKLYERIGADYGVTSTKELTLEQASQLIEKLSTELDNAE